MYDATDANKIKKTSTAHQLLIGNRWAFAEKVYWVPYRLMDANLRLIIAYWNIYVKSLCLFECESFTGIRAWHIFCFCASIQNQTVCWHKSNDSQPLDLLLSKLNTSNKTKIQRFLNNSYTHTGVGSCRAITSDVFRNEQANQFTVYQPLIATFQYRVRTCSCFIHKSK